ncbi:DUF4913 domain-containing protein [Arthrobacter sp. CP30]
MIWAVSRLNALWRAWETLRLDPGTGMSDWWRIHADGGGPRPEHVYLGRPSRWGTQQEVCPDCDQCQVK